MRIAYITTANIPDSWAHSIQIMNMCKAFAQNGADVTLLVPRRPFLDIHGEAFAYYGMKPTFSIQKIWCVDLFPGHPSVVLYWLRLISFYVSARIYTLFVKFDVIYSRDVYTPVLFPGVVLERHSFPKKVSSFTKYVFSRVRGIVVLTSFIKNKLVSIGVATQSVLVAPDAVDEESFVDVVPKSLEQYGITEKDSVCGYIGTLKTMGMEKGLAYCIEAMALLSERYKLLVVGGEDVDIQFYTDMAVTYGVQDRVVFVGKVPHREVPAFARACDVLLAPFPENEHYSFYMSSLKIFEYMASGKPIITTALPSIEEVLVHNKTAFLVSAKDPKNIAQELVDTIISIENDPVSAQRIADEALREVAQKYTWRKRAEGILNFVQHSK